MEKAKEAGAKRAVALNVSGAFHSPLMESARRGLASALSEVEIHRATIPVVANASAEVVTDPEGIRESLARQLMSPVCWEASMRRLLEDPGPPFLEVGPGKILKGLLRTIERSASCASVGAPGDMESITS